MVLIPDCFATVSLEQMKAVRLMNRVDTKFVTTEHALARLLELAVSDYAVQEIGGQTLMPYYTRYYDTADAEMYHHHLHGRLTRKKVRVRRYESSGLEFLEVKRKSNKGRTDKRRISTGELTDSDRHSFLLDTSAYDDSLLTARLENRFNRLTLVNRDMTERLTIDTGLRFSNPLSGIVCSMEGLAIIELKRDGRIASPISGLLNTLRIKQSGFSKYCMGMAFTDPSVSINRFKPRMRMIEKLCNPGLGILQHNQTDTTKSPLWTNSNCLTHRLSTPAI